MISGKRGWEEDRTYQTRQHFLQGAVQKLAQDFGQHAGQRQRVGSHHRYAHSNN